MITLVDHFNEYLFQKFYMNFKWFVTQINGSWCGINTGSFFYSNLNWIGQKRYSPNTFMHGFCGLNFEALMHQFRWSHLSVGDLKLVLSPFRFSFLQEWFVFKVLFLSLPLLSVRLPVYLSSFYILLIKYTKLYLFLSFSVVVFSTNSYSLRTFSHSHFHWVLIYIHTERARDDMRVRECYRFSTLEILNEVLCNFQKWSDKKMNARGRTYITCNK